MKKIIILLAVLALSASVFASEKRPSTEHKVYYQGTDYELNVYKIKGRKDGKTILIVGGIQGDEPGGFLSADLYSELKLEKGNLIVIPRANLKSIILYDRGPDGDMNRQFGDGKNENKMAKVVDVIKEVMAESDVFLNLHDGWGYHYPEHVDKWRNPKRFGQSIITDANEYKCQNGKTLDLKTPANEVLKNVNAMIHDEKYHLHYFNTKTHDTETKFKDMRKTATYYALRAFCIPAFGIESSKNLPTLEMKVLHHNYSVNEFMKYYGVIPEHPQVFLMKPKLQYSVIAVNGVPKIVDDGRTLHIEEDDQIEITHIESNYQRGLSSDVLGYGDLNDYRKKVTVKDSTRIVFRKDNKKMGTINVKVNGGSVKPLHNGNESRVVFIVKVNKKEYIVLNEQTLDVPEGAILRLGSVLSNTSYGKSIPVNFKGYVPKITSGNSGDDRGYKISMVRSNFMAKYSRYGKNRVFPIVASYRGKELGMFWVNIK